MDFLLPERISSFYPIRKRTIPDYLTKLSSALFSSKNQAHITNVLFYPGHTLFIQRKFRNLFSTRGLYTRRWYLLEHTSGDVFLYDITFDIYP